MRASAFAASKEANSFTHASEGAERVPARCVLHKEGQGEGEEHGTRGRAVNVDESGCLEK